MTSAFIVWPIGTTVSRKRRLYRRELSNAGTRVGSARD